MDDGYNFGVFVIWWTMCIHTSSYNDIMKWLLGINIHWRLLYIYMFFFSRLIAVHPAIDHSKTKHLTAARLQERQELMVAALEKRWQAGDPGCTVPYALAFFVQSSLNVPWHHTMDVFVNGLVYHPTGNSMGTIVINQLVQRFSVKPLGAVTKPCLIGYKRGYGLMLSIFWMIKPT